MIQPKFTRADLLAASDKTLKDLIARYLSVLFCGINPGLYSAFSGHHFARPGNRFWPALHAGGFTERRLEPFEERELLSRGYGITNVVKRASATADQLTTDELIAGGKILIAKVRRFRPRFLAILGVGAFRVAFAHSRAALGLQPDKIGASRVWVLPSPSGLNAHYQPGELAKLFRKLHEASER